MPADNWLDETVPSRKKGKDRGRHARPAARSVLAEIPGRVWVFVGFAAVLLLVLCALWGIYLLRGRFSPQSPTPTAIIWTPTASRRPAATPSRTPAEPESEEPPDGATPTASTGIVIGGYVQIAGTGGDGLSLRSGPGANYARLAVASEGSVFIVVEGPTTAAGAPWWRIRDPENEEQVWWAIGNYLEPVDHP
ncbi:MAG: SH3 domain-containing protein [Anaerolineae bacterium]|jgi:hypothetical protein